MIVIPVFNELEISNYGLFPNADGTFQNTIDFNGGLTVIAGVNGLGKTTILNMLLRSLTGPFDITGHGAPESYEAILPKDPVSLRKGGVNFFAQRVADGASEASCRLSLNFKNRKVVISRRLGDLSLAELRVSGRAVELPKSQARREAVYQQTMSDLFNLSSFVDVLLVLHNLVFLTEKRAGALWDANAQRHLLDAIFLDKTSALAIAQAARDVQSADSQFRNTRSQFRKFESQLNEALAAEQTSPEIKAELAAKTRALEGLQEQFEQLQSDLGEKDESRRRAVLTLEKAKLTHEAATGEVERAKYTSLMHLFPQMEDAARLHLSRILSEEVCLVCGAEAQEKKASLESLLLEGKCPACEAGSEDQKFTAPAKKFEAKKMQRANERMSLAGKELTNSRKQFEAADREYELALTSFVRMQAEIKDLLSTSQLLKSKLPQSDDETEKLKELVATFEKTMKRELGELSAQRKSYAEALDSVRNTIVDGASKLSSRFGSYIHDILSEEAKLIQIQSRAKIGQYGEEFEFPAFVPEMAAANRPGLTRRNSASDVSESQRELIDLAFRLALMDVTAGNSAATFLMETPEASLDGIAMSRVGAALKNFIDSNKKRLIVTTNLTNSDIVTALFGGKSRSKKETAQRFERVFNLIEHAAPNETLNRNRKGYEKLLESSVSGIDA